MAVCTGVFLFAQPNEFIGDTSDLKEEEFFLEWAAIPCELVTNQPLTYFEYFEGTCGAPARGEAAYEGYPATVTDEIFPDKYVWGSAGTSLFLHADVWHLLGNLLFLFVFGRIVEDRLGMISYLAAYIIFGAAALAAHVAFNMDSVVPVIGASGAIAGLMGMFIVMWPKSNILTLAVYTVIPIPAWLLLGAWFGLQFVFSDDSGVAYAAHIGGFVAGVVLGLVLRSVRPPDEGEDDRSLGHDTVNPYTGR